MKRLLLYLVAIVTLYMSSLDALAFSVSLWGNYNSGNQWISGITMELSNGWYKASNVTVNKEGNFQIRKTEGNNTTYYKSNWDNTTVQFGKDMGVVSANEGKDWWFNSSQYGTYDFYLKSDFSVIKVVKPIKIDNYSNVKVIWKSGGTGWSNEYSELFNNDGIATIEVKTDSSNNGFNLYITNGSEKIKIVNSDLNDSFQLDEGNNANFSLFSRDNESPYVTIKNGYSKTFIVTLNVKNGTINIVDKASQSHTYAYQWEVKQGDSWSVVPASAEAYTFNPTGDFKLRLGKKVDNGNFSYTYFKANEAIKNGTYDLTYNGDQTVAISLDSDYENFSVSFVPTVLEGDIDPATKAPTLTVSATAKTPVEPTFTYDWFVYQVNKKADGGLEYVQTPLTLTKNEDGTLSTEPLNCYGVSIQLKENGKWKANYGKGTSNTYSSGDIQIDQTEYLIFDSEYKDFVITIPTSGENTLVNNITINLTSTKKQGGNVDPVNPSASWPTGCVTSNFKGQLHPSYNNNWSNWLGWWDVNNAGNADRIKFANVTADKLEYQYQLNGSSYYGEDIDLTAIPCVKKITPISGNNIGHVTNTSGISNFDVYYMHDGSNFYMIFTEVGGDLSYEPEPENPDAVKVYLIDRAKWGNVSAYNYTDANLDSNGNVNEGDYNAKWPGAQMTECNDKNILDNLDLVSYDENGNKFDAKVYQITLKGATEVTEANGEKHLSHPKLVFTKPNGGNAEKQTLNLFAVKNGIYQTPYYLPRAEGATESEYVANGSEYLPNQWYDTDADLALNESYVLPYPNAKHSTKTNTFYIAVPEFTNKVIYEGADKIDVEISFEREGNSDYKATGITGTHKAFLTEIDGEQYLRVTLADYIVKNAQKPINLYIWEDGKDKKFTDEDGGQHVGDKEFVENGNHTACEKSYCSLYYEGITYLNNAVYRRGTITDINELTAPDAVYMVNLGNNDAFEYMTGGKVQTTAPSDIVSGTFYRMTKNSGNGATTYVAKKVKGNAKFVYVAHWADGTYKVLSGATNTVMTPGTAYPCKSQTATGNSYTIKEAFASRTLDVTFTWENQNVFCTPNAKTPGWKLVTNTGLNDNDKFTPIEGLHMIKGEKNDCKHDHPDEIILVQHDKSFGGMNDDHYKYVTVTLEPQQKFVEAVAMSTNLPPKFYNNITDEWDGTKEAISIAGAYMYNVEDSSDELSGVKIHAYTAGDYTLTIKNEKIEGANLAADEASFNIRVLPTVESLGLTLNFHPIANAHETDADEPNSYGSANEYQIDAIGKPFEMGGKKYDDNRIGIFPTEAAGDIKIYWKWANGNSPKQSAKSIVRRAVATDASSIMEENKQLQNEDGDFLVADDMVRYTVNANDEGKDDGNGHVYGPVLTRKAIEDNGGLTLQVVHNGIASPMYVASNNNDGVATGVDELEAAAESAEAVYYDLNGYRVDAANLCKGIYVKVTGDKAEKVVVK